MNAFIAFLLILFTSTTFAYDTQSEIGMLRKEIQQLSKKVRYLERRVIALEGIDDTGNSNMQWGCYLNDIRAGGLFSHAATEAEARGKVLSQCTSKKGACFDNQITCSKSD
ncbi:hypothetical protein [Endozoicomonas sp.]|uniref:hypothetical protein n=1 Tax=Endozoicomonas sp. TaxID=1892382 RepID=UPI003AF9C015